MTYEIKNNDKIIESNNLFEKEAILKFNTEILRERKFQFVSEIFALTRFFENDKNTVEFISNFALLVQQTSETVFLDKLFSNAQISCKKEISFQSIPTIVKKIHVILNYASIPEKEKIKHLEFVRNLIKFYTKTIVNFR